MWGIQTEMSQSCCLQGILQLLGLLHAIEPGPEFLWVCGTEGNVALYTVSFPEEDMRYNLVTRLN